MPIDSYDCKTVNKNSEFYISIGMQGIHSFLMLGFINEEGKPENLLRVGKTDMIDDSSTNLIKMNFKRIFSHTLSKLKGELLTPLEMDMTYAAYTISFEQYKQFIDLLAYFYQKTEEENEGLEADEQKRRRIFIDYFHPVKETSESIEFKKRKIEEHGQTLSYVPNRDGDRIRGGSKGLSFPSHTCRNTAIDLMSYVQAVDQVASAVPKSFFRRLPLKMRYREGKPQDTFFVFPPPPNAYFDADKQKINLLKTIYKRMENLLSKDIKSEATRDKFNALKELYNQQAGPMTQGIDAMLDCIRNWRQKNDSVISVLRDQSFLGKLFVSKSSTVKMVEELENELEKNKAGPRLE